MFFWSDFNKSVFMQSDFTLRKTIINQMEKQKAQPNPTPNLSSEEDPIFPDIFEHLSLTQKTASNQGTQLEYAKNKNKTQLEKTKKIQKKILSLKRSYKKKVQPQKKQNYKKKVISLQRRVCQLESEIDRLRKKMQGCPECRYYCYKKQEVFNFDQYRPNFQQEMKKIAGSLNDSRGSMGSVEFQNVDFGAGLMMTKDMDDKAWVYMGVMMIAMGSKCLEVDGSINVFRVLSETVDTLRRQVEKSSPNISMDFYLTQQQMKQNNFMEDIGFDPFTQKISGGSGLALQGVKVQSVEQFQLIYDNKVTYNIKYEALLGAMQYIRENSWLTF